MFIIVTVIVTAEFFGVRFGAEFRVLQKFYYINTCTPLHYIE